MPAQSKQQQKFMGIVRAIQKGDQPASKFSKKAQDAADDMKKKDVEKFASTKHKGLPKKVEQALREKIKSMVEDYVESCGYVVSAKDPNYKLKSPGGTGEEDRELKEVHKMKGAQGKMVVVPDNYVARYGKVQYNLMKKLGYTGGDHNIIRHMDFGYQNYHRLKPNDQFNSSIILKSYPKGDFGDKDGRIRKKDVMVVLKELMRQLKANRLKLDKKPVYRPDVNNPMIEFRVKPEQFNESINEMSVPGDFDKELGKLKFNQFTPTNVKRISKKFKVDYKDAVKWIKLNYVINVANKPTMAESVNENTTYKVGDTISYWTIGRIDKGKAKVKGVTKARPNRLGIKNHYITNKGTFSDMEVVGTEAYKLRFKGNTEKKVMKAMGVKEGFGSDEFLTKTEKKKFEKERLENAEVLGYTLTGTKDLKESVNEDGHTDVPSAVRKLKTSIEDALQIIGYLKKVNDAEPLPSWWTNKVTLSSNYLNTARDYILNPHESVFAVRQDKIKDDERYAKKPNFDYDPEKGKSRIRKVNEGSAVIDTETIKVVKFTRVKANSPLHKHLKDITKKVGANVKKIHGGYIVNTDNDMKKLSAVIDYVKKKMKKSKVNEGSLDWEKKHFPWANKKEQMMIAKLVFSAKNGIEDIVKQQKKNPSSFKNHIKRMVKKGLHESVNEGKGVDKIMKMADDYSYGKIAGKTVDVMTAKLFQAVYKKASQKARDRVDKMNEKQLYIFMMNLWKKFGKQLTLSS